MHHLLSNTGTGEACIKANLIWAKTNPMNYCFHVFHNNASKDKSLVHFLENFLRNKIDHYLSHSKTKFITVSKSCAISMKNRKNFLNIRCREASSKGFALPSLIKEKN